MAQEEMPFPSSDLFRILRANSQGRAINTKQTNGRILRHPDKPPSRCLSPNSNLEQNRIIVPIPPSSPAFSHEANGNISQIQSPPKFIQSLNLDHEKLEQLVAHVKNTKMSYTQAVLQLQLMSEQNLYERIAHYLKLDLLLDYDEIIETYNIGIKDTGSHLKMPPKAKILAAVSSGGMKTYITAPEDREIEQTKKFISQNPKMAHRIKITTPKILHGLKYHRANKPRLKFAVDCLRIFRPDLSASNAMSPEQSAKLVTVIISTFIFFTIFPILGVLSIHIFAMIFFASCIAIRIAATVIFSSQYFAEATKYKLHNHQALPYYSVLVALYHEENQVAQLIAALSRLNWPKEKLEIKLICESDDEGTITAIKKSSMPANFELVIVPSCQPKTKPKALNYALPSCKGQYVVLYDAEDIPHPDQLLEAYTYFQESAENVACVQAPLLIHNHQYNWLSSMFAIEYSALFDGLLPALVKFNSFVPLGGTSNHFKRDAIEKIHAWDPFNVTEDADLGMRLMRYGYRAGTITLPTLEEAPITVWSFIKQRTRWFKGWIQTWLVHSQSPVTLMQDIGFFKFLGFQILTLGMIISSLIYPTLLISLFYSIYNLFTYGTNIIERSIFCCDMIMIIMGYLSFALLAHKTLSLRNKRFLIPYLFSIPFYWLLLSFASWRASIQFFTNPFKWEKTKHGHAVYIKAKQ
jgi:cellulose synthase/poly-beta-1,6-N-acetylglucosamine synthase-like glycosyltransferase